MKLLHTSDWHLGVRTDGVSRGPDHEHFFAWLLATLDARAIDALIVAGDIFDGMAPSAAALRRYYRFLARLSETGVKQVVIVGGNHDAASRLDAPAEVLSALNVHVVGGLDSEAARERCVVPLLRRDGAVGAVALAVPYVHEFRLGVRTTDPDHRAVKEAFRARFTELYRDLADRAAARFPGLPIVATGHLTLGAARRDDYPQEIHAVGTINGLPPTILDPRIQYTALGHIHRSYPVDEARRAWYSGSPIAVSVSEATPARNVLVVTLSPDPAGQPEVERVPVPAARGWVRVEGAPQAVIDAVRALTWEEPLPPLVHVTARTDDPTLDLMPRLREAAARPDEASPHIVELKLARATAAPELDPAPTHLRAMTPQEVFADLLSRTGRSEPDLEGAFARIASATDDDIDAMCAELEAP